MFAGKPIIGIAGGIGSGKTFVADLFGEMGCLVIHSDEQVRGAYESPEVKDQLRQWWGSAVFTPTGDVDRRAIAARVFNNPAERARLERLVHPLVAQARDLEMARHAADPKVVAFVWDTPLLFETGLNEECDAVVFVEVPVETRLSRVAAARGWTADELRRRENLQMPLDRKREMSDHVIRNTADADKTRGQVRDVLFRILAGATQEPARG